MSNTRRQTRLFSLLELIIALVGSAVLLAALLVVLSAAWRLQTQSDRYAAEALPRDAARATLRHDLDAAVTPSGIMRGAFLAETVESGAERLDTLEFVAAVGARNGDHATGDLLSLRYELVEAEDGDGYTLWRTENRYLLALELDEDELPARPIASGLSGFTVQAYDGTDWVDGWDSTAQENALPTAIRIRLDYLEDADGRQAAPLELLLPMYESPRPEIVVAGVEVQR